MNRFITKSTEGKSPTPCTLTTMLDVMEKKASKQKIMIHGRMISNVAQIHHLSLYLVGPREFSILRCDEKVGNARGEIKSGRFPFGIVISIRWHNYTSLIFCFVLDSTRPSRTKTAQEIMLSYFARLRPPAPLRSTATTKVQQRRQNLTRCSTIRFDYWHTIFG